MHFFAAKGLVFKIVLLQRALEYCIFKNNNGHDHKCIRAYTSIIYPVLFSTDGGF